MKDIKIITTAGELDLDDSVGFGLNISVDDLKKLGTKNSTYTKTVKLLGTKKNNEILGNIFSVNSTFTFFNPNFKLSAKLIVNDAILIDGYLQLSNIIIDNETSLAGNKIVYEVTLSDNVIDFYGICKDKLLTDLDLTELTHELTSDNIRHSWTGHTADNGYVYPIFYKDSNAYQTSDFKPSIFNKFYLMKIFEESGYSVGGTFLTNPTFIKEIIPFNGEVVMIDEAEINRRKFSTSVDNQTDLSTYLFNDPTYTFDTGEIDYTGFDDDSTGANFDNGNHWDLVDNKWTVDRNGRYNLKGNVRFQLIWQQLTGIETWFFDGFGNLNGDLTLNSNYSVQLNCYKNGALLFNTTVLSELPKSYDLLSTFNAGNEFKVINDILIPINRNNISLKIGDEITFKFKVSTNNIANYRNNNTGYAVGAQVPISIKIKSAVNSILFNEPIASLPTDGDVINVTEYVPKTIKQSDLIDDIIKRYNLIIRTDKDNPKKILLDCRDDYYAAGATIDWTNKKDYSTPDKISLLSSLQDKEVNFTYKKDSDVVNTNWTNAVDGSKIYGELTVKFDNEFTTNIKKVESIFSPTPLVYNTTGARKTMVISYIPANNPNNNIRVLLWGGLLPTLTPPNMSNLWTFESVESGVPTTNSYATYPYAGHFDNYLTPQADINWNHNQFYFYNEIATTPNNNLYNSNWRNTIEQLTTGRLITSKFKLNEIDIEKIKNNLNLKIWVKDSYYHVNEIKDYNPLGDGLTTVELSKVYNTNKFTKENYTIGTVYNDYEIDELTAGASFDDSNIITGSVGGLVRGEENRIGVGAINGLIVGDGNEISDNTKSATILGGDGNTINSPSKSSIILGGDNNTIGPVNNSGVIAADGKTVTQDNELWLTKSVHIVNDTLNVKSDILINDVPLSSLFMAGSVDLTYTDLQTLIANNEVVGGTLYHITDRRIYLHGLSANRVSVVGHRIMDVVKSTYYTPQFIGVGVPIPRRFCGVWGDYYARGATPVSDAFTEYYAIWGGKLWKRNTSGADSSIGEATLGAGWTQVIGGSLYNEKLFDIKFDIANDWVFEQTDDRGNKITNIYDSGLPFNGIDITDWGYEKIYNNVVLDGIYNNITTNGIYGNANKGGIVGNSNTGQYGISNNNNNGYIAGNSTTGMFGIYSNNNNGSINNNSNTDIFNNKNNGFITNNSNPNYIYNNINNGNIFGATVGVIFDTIVNK